MNGDYKKLNIDRVGTAGYPMVGYETKQSKSNVSENQFMNTLIEKEDAVKNDHAEKAFRSVAPNAPEKVKTAWRKQQQRLA